VAEKLVSADTASVGQINLDEEVTSGDIADQVTAYFEASKKADATVAVKLEAE
jgi:hypothetical protein